MADSLDFVFLAISDSNPPIGSDSTEGITVAPLSDPPLETHANNNIAVTQVNSMSSYEQFLATFYLSAADLSLLSAKDRAAFALAFLQQQNTNTPFLSSSPSAGPAGEQLVLGTEKPEVICKRGSCLSQAHEASFRAIEVNRINTDMGNIVSSASRHVVKDVQKMVHTFTAKMMVNKQQGNTDEVKYVQKDLAKLLQSVLRVIIPGKDISLCQKEPDCSIKIAYSTSIVINDIEIRVTGESDIVIYYQNIPIGIVEAKSLVKSLKSPNEKAEALVEIKGFSEKFELMVGCEAPLFPGILVSGKEWSFPARVVGETQCYLMPVPIETINSAGEVVHSGIVSTTHALIKFMHSVAALSDIIDNYVGRLLHTNESISTPDQDQENPAGGGRQSEHVPPVVPLSAVPAVLSRTRAATKYSGASGQNRKALAPLTTNTLFVHNRIANVVL